MPAELTPLERELLEACRAALPHIPGYTQHARDLLIAAIARAEAQERAASKPGGET